MKVNRTRSIAKNNMRRSGQKKKRPEQILAGALLETHLPYWTTVDLEKEVKLLDADNPLVPYEISIDVAVNTVRKKVAIELNGPPHDELRLMRKDNRRKIILEWIGNDWEYLVFDYKYMPTLFLRNQRELDYDEAVKAYGEILVTVGDVLPLQDTNKSLIEEVLRKTQLS